MESAQSPVDVKKAECYGDATHLRNNQGWPQLMRTWARSSVTGVGLVAVGREARRYSWPRVRELFARCFETV